MQPARALSRVWLPTSAGWEYPLSPEALEQLRLRKARIAGAPGG